jgi:hypothetical protein
MDAVDEQRREGLSEKLGDWSAADILDLVGSLARYNETLDSAG